MHFESLLPILYSIHIYIRPFVHRTILGPLDSGDGGAETKQEQTD